MKNLTMFLLGTVIALCSGSAVYERIETPLPVPFVVEFSKPELTIYAIASRVTGCPEEILIGIDFAESSNGLNLNHPDPLDVGRFGLHESVAYHKERAAKYGEYNPDCPLDSAIIAGRLYMDNLKLLGNSADAICAHYQGPTGVRRDGRAEWYLERVLNPVLC